MLEHTKGVFSGAITGAAYGRAADFTAALLQPLILPITFSSFSGTVSTAVREIQHRWYGRPPVACIRVLKHILALGLMDELRRIEVRAYR
jgi:hypothetical protein